MMNSPILLTQSEGVKLTMSSTHPFSQGKPLPSDYDSIFKHFGSIKHKKLFVVRQGKIPVHPITLRRASALLDKNRLDLGSAINHAKMAGDGYGVGIVLEEGYWCLDIDKRKLADGAYTENENTQELLAMLPEAYCEISQSGLGYHLIGNGQIPGHKCKNREVGIELYTKKRFIALTGVNARGNIYAECTENLLSIVKQYFPPEKTTNASLDSKKSVIQSTHTLLEEVWTTTPYNGWNGFKNDDELIKAALKSKSAAAVFGGKASFCDLWKNNTTVLNGAYNSDKSAMDMALACHLAFWTGSNCERMKTLMLRSGLFRDKYDRDDYLHRTIRKACAIQISQPSKNTSSENATRATQKSTLSDCAEETWVEIPIADIHTNPPAPPLFYVDQILPAGVVTLLAGHGGTGKSMLALQAAVCLATGNSFLDKKTKLCRVLFLSGEDDKNVIRYRLKNICLAMEIETNILEENLLVIDATEDPCLFAPTGSTGNSKAEITNKYTQLKKRIKSFSANVIIIDNASDTYDANENVRSEVRGYMRALKQLTKETNGAVLLLTHLDKAKVKGESKNNEGYSGSTAWHNSARSRLYIHIDLTGDLIIEHQKSNFGYLANLTTLERGEHGVLTLKLPVSSEHIERLIKKEIQIRYEEGCFVSPEPRAKNYAYKVLEPNLAGLGNNLFKRILSKLLKTGEIIEETYKSQYRKDIKRLKVLDANSIFGKNPGGDSA